MLLRFKIYIDGCYCATEYAHDARELLFAWSSVGTTDKWRLDVVAV